MESRKKMLSTKMRLMWSVCMSIGIYTSYASYEFDEDVLEDMFIKYHPNLDNIVWKEVENLTAEVLQRICYDVLGEILPPRLLNIKDFHYIPVPPSKLQVERVTRGVILKLQKTTAKITVVKCAFAQMVINITHAKDDHVFDLYPEYTRKPPRVFTLKSGAYPVHYH